jgi:hypothetical protein
LNIPTVLDNDAPDRYDTGVGIVYYKYGMWL